MRMSQMTRSALRLEQASCRSHLQLLAQQDFLHSLQAAHHHPGLCHAWNSLPTACACSCPYQH